MFRKVGSLACMLVCTGVFVQPLRAHLSGYDPNPHPFEQSPNEVLEVAWKDQTFTFPPPPQSIAGISPAARQPVGALTGRLVFMSAGHGWMYDPDFSPPWRVMRPSPLNDMNEDYGNVDQLSIFATYCFNAGATVIAFRPIGNQTNEVVLDNESANVTWAGTWSNTSDSIYFGSASAAVRYRFASLAASETATATYTPNIPKAGYYPVYTWVRHGANRGNQLYRVRHTGGESQVIIPHHMVGNGWVYLGQYYFNAGSNSLSGAVVISNLRSTAQGSVVIADAIRFGNGMGSIVRGGGVSAYPREDECSRYWVQAGIGQGQSSTLYDGGSGTDDESDSWHTPPRMSAEMNNESVETNIFKRIHVSFHSNAAGTTARGTTALANNNTAIRTPNQYELAQIMADIVDQELIDLGSPPLESTWGARGTVYSSGNYTEISNDYFNDEMDATLLEVAFHDNVTDARLLRDSKARAAVARATVHSIIQFFHKKDGLATNYFPECPTNVRAIGATNGSITVSWTAPITGKPAGYSHAATNYVIYRSADGFGFGNPISVGNVTTYTITNLAPDVDYYFQVAAANAGGESMPSEVVGCRVSTTSPVKVLYVNAFDRFDRTTNLRQDTARQSWDPPGPTGGIERVWPRAVNAFNYVVPHGKAIASYGASFDTCQNEAVANAAVALGNYPIVIWACGQESTTDETFNSTEQTRVSAFINSGGHLFVSGSEIGWDLDRASGPTSADRSFYNNYLRADFGSDTNDSSGIYTVTAVSGSIFAGRSSMTFDNGTKGFYWVQYSDILTPFGTGSVPALYYNGTTNVAGLQYTPPSGSAGRLVYFGFPFETVTSTTRQNQYMSDILDFFTPAKITTGPSSLTVNQGANATFTVVAGGHGPLSYQWKLNGANLSGRTTSALTITNAQPSDAGAYSVVVTNSSGTATSSSASLTVRVPPTIVDQPQSQTVSISENATFNVGVTGTAPFGYQWRFNDAPISGATLNSYTITNIQAQHAGNYSVLVTNVAGSALSENAVLSIPVPPAFASVVISSNAIQLTLSGQPEGSVLLQGSSNLIDWTTITNIVLTNGSVDFSEALTNQQQFYRLLQE